MFNFKSFAKQCTRVWHLLKKPDSYEFKTVAKVSAIGLVVVGFIGFAISMIFGYFGLK
ncbi:protein translocase SEC61 complex subunit gamma [Candidatus Pacearchaeota archaeon]|nr:protein translocase SEC61 complex subunit gamma [Candidatus Pacearchaeota archaeon]